MLGVYGKNPGEAWCADRAGAKSSQAKLTSTCQFQLRGFLAVGSKNHLVFPAATSKRRALTISNRCSHTDG